MASFFSKVRQWYIRRPERSLDLAYEAALRIQKLEEDYFEGNPVNPDAGYGESTYIVLRSQLHNHLTTIRLRLLEYRLFTLVPADPQRNILVEPLSEEAYNAQIPSIAEKLELIDAFLDRYKQESQLVRLPSLTEIVPDQTDIEPTRVEVQSQILNKSRQIYSERSFIPISFLVTFQRFKDILTPGGTKFEEELVDEVQRIRRRTVYAFAFLGLLLVATISVEFIAKNFIYGPIIDAIQSPQGIEIRFTETAREEALEKLRKAKENLEFEALIATISGKKVDQEAGEKHLQEEAKKILVSYNKRSREGIKNLLADITTFIAINVLIVLGKNQIAVIRIFIVETLQGLSDSAKAFLIIVATDTFVGYHSSDGWDALITVLLYRFGLPESHILSDAFIATVPVFLDALFKFWIFQYLRRASPSTAAIYREMNE